MEQSRRHFLGSVLGLAASAVASPIIKPKRSLFFFASNGRPPLTLQNMHREYGKLCHPARTDAPSLIRPDVIIVTKKQKDWFREQIGHIYPTWKMVDYEGKEILTFNGTRVSTMGELCGFLYNPCRVDEKLET